METPSTLLDRRSDTDARSTGWSAERQAPPERVDVEHEEPNVVRGYD